MPPRPSTVAPSSPPQPRIAATVLLRGLLIALVLGGLLASYSYLSINPGIGEGEYLNSQSFRYQVGIWLEQHNALYLILFIAAAWPVVLLDLAEIHHIPLWLQVGCVLLSGVGWSWLVHNFFAICGRLNHVPQRASRRK